MKVSLKQLVDDHINLSYLMITLAQRAESCRTGKDWKESLAFMQNAMDYLCDYPVQVHHPIENRVIAFIEEDSNVDLQQLAELPGQHVELEQQTTAFRDQLKQLPDDADDAFFLQLNASLQKLIQHHLQHLHAEEQHLFPMLEECLNEDGWRKLNDQLAESEQGRKLQQHKNDFSPQLERLVRQAASEQTAYS